MTSDRHTALADGLVLDAARAAILDVGWRRTTLTDVARRAGCSRMTLYRRWPDMAALLGDLMTREWGDVLVEEALVGQSVPDLVVGLARRIRTDPLFAKIRHVDPELLLPYLLDRRGRVQHRLLAALEVAITAGQETGAIRDGNPVALARTVLLTSQGVVVSFSTMVDDDLGEADLEAELGRLVTAYLAP